MRGCWPGAGAEAEGLTGTGELRRIHSRVSWMLCPVERSIIVSAPQIVLHCSFSTSCSMQLTELLIATPFRRLLAWPQRLQNSRRVCFGPSKLVDTFM